MEYFDFQEQTVQFDISRSIISRPIGSDTNAIQCQLELCIKSRHWWAYVTMIVCDRQPFRENFGLKHSLGPSSALGLKGKSEADSSALQSPKPVTVLPISSGCSVSSK